MTTTPKFRYIGTTDECVECQKCGKVDLKSTIVLAILDAEGNEEDITYYGSTCAARALSIKGGGRAVRQAAEWANLQTRQNADDARRRLAYYGLPETGEIDGYTLANAVIKYAEQHSRAHWAAEKTGAQWREMVLEMVAYERAALAEAALIGA